MSRARNLFLFCVLATIWGSSFVAIKVGLRAFDPVFFAALRYDVAGALVLAYAAATTDRWRPRTRPEWLVVGVGSLLLFAAYHAFLFVGEDLPGVTAAAAAVIVSLTAVLTPTFGRYLLPSQRLSPVGVLGLLLGVVGVAVLVLHARDLNVLLLSEEDAHSLGVEVERTKALLLAVSALVTAASVAFVGIIGFVGLVVPHVVRLVVGPDHRILLPTSALAGASFLVAADTVARSGPAELPVGIVTAALGAPFFVYLLRSREVAEL